MARKKNYDHYEHKSFDRPKGSRPRTKIRPDYSDRPVGRVITVDRGRYKVLYQGLTLNCTKARQLGRKSVIVGDLVRLDGDVSATVGTLARIVEVLERKTVLRRTADDTDPYERPMVANAEQLVIVTALADPPPRPGMIDRILVAAYEAKLQPLLCLTKADLADPEELIKLYEPIDVPLVVTGFDRDTLALETYLKGKVSVLVGHSGVGKSTLVNALIPQANRAVQTVDVKGKGQHTSTSAIAMELPDGGWIIDTPGVRSFGLNHVEPNNVIHAFLDLEQACEACPRGCNHIASAEECGLDAASAAGILPIQRVESFRRVIDALYAAQKRRFSS